MTRVQDLRDAMTAVSDPAHAAVAARFFKTGPGEYGEGDEFIGVRVPDTRKAVRPFFDLEWPEIAELLASRIHEYRLAGLIILVRQSEVARRQGDIALRREISRRYLGALDDGQINNWDLVDVSAPVIVGEPLVGESPDILFDLAERPALWHRRVAVLASFAFIDAGDPAVTFALADVLLEDRRDLIQKAVGWSLRHVGKRVGTESLLAYLDAHAAQMGRTALSYATEHIDKDVRARLRAL